MKPAILWYIFYVGGWVLKEEDETHFSRLFSYQKTDNSLSSLITPTKSEILCVSYFSPWTEDMWMNTVHACDRYCYLSPEVQDCFPSADKCKQWITTLNTSRSDDLSKSVLQHQKAKLFFFLNQKLTSFPPPPCASLKLKCPKCRCRWSKHHVHKKLTVWFHRVNCRNISPLTACRNSYCIVKSQSILQKK